MADAVVSVVLEQLGSALAVWVKEEVCLVVGVKEELRNVSNRLQTIRNVLEDAEKRSVEEAAVKGWLERLEDLSYEMEDVLDEWNTAILKRRAQQAHKLSSSSFTPSSSSSSSSKPSCFPCSNRVSCFGFKKLGVRRDIAKKIKDINSRLNSVFKEKDDFRFTSNTPSDVHIRTRITDIELERMKTTSFIRESEVHGRDSDRNVLLSKLLSDNEGIITISIVGVGGLGKTTLAQLVYNDENVKVHFNLKIWVCVSDPFDEVRVAKAILEALEGNTPHVNELEALHGKIQSSITGQKILLVLDDVWDESPQKFERLNRSLQTSLIGSKILVTTRSDVVARVMGTSQANLIKLELMSDSDCWSLIKQIALQGKRNEEYEKFESVGNQIAMKCKGLPLAAKTLGGALLLKDSVEEWEEILNSEIWKLKEATIDLFPHLFLSYREFPSQIKRCFIYCATHPKDSELIVEDIVSQWMALGYLALNKDDDEDMEQVGLEYFNHLARHSFLQDFVTRNGRIYSAKMHDIVHDFALYLSKDEILTISSQEKPKGGKARHLYLKGSYHHPVYEVVDPVSICDVGKLRTFAISHSDEVKIDLFQQLKLVRQLRLHYCGLEEIPKEVGKLVHLRLLEIRRNDHLRVLPETIGDLLNLQYLKIDNCQNLIVLPQSIGELINLRHLKFSSHSVKKAPSVERLTRLRTLEPLLLGGQFGKLEDLKDLNSLRHLDIKFMSDMTVEEEKDVVRLRDKKTIKMIYLSFNYHNVLKVVYEEALQPPSTIQELIITGITDKGLPRWLMMMTESSLFNNLTRLDVGDCGNISSLPPLLWKLPSLERLRIWKIGGLKCIGRNFVGIAEEGKNGNKVESGGVMRCERSAPPSSAKHVAFPRLVELMFIYCEEWEEWEDISAEEEEDTSSALTLFPALQELGMWCCRRLKALPHRLLRRAPSLQRLIILECEQLFDEDLKKDIRVRQLVSHIPRLRINGRDYTRDNVSHNE